MLEKTLESPLDCKEIQQVHPKGNQSWIFTGRLEDAKAETPIHWLLDENWLIGKDPHAGKNWKQEKKGTTEDKMVDGITVLVNMSLNKSGVFQSMGLQRIGYDWATELNWFSFMFLAPQIIEGNCPFQKSPLPVGLS